MDEACRKEIEGRKEKLWEMEGVVEIRGDESMVKEE